VFNVPSREHLIELIQKMCDVQEAMMHKKKRRANETNDMETKQMVGAMKTCGDLLTERCLEN
jgi:hypothetical protein